MTHLGRRLKTITVLMGDLNLVGERGENMQSAALWAANNQQHRCLITIDLNFKKSGDTKDMVIGVDREDL